MRYIKILENKKDHQDNYLALINNLGHIYKVTEQTDKGIILLEKGLKRAKQFKDTFFKQHDLILAMDLSNRAALLKLAKSEEDKNKILMFLSFDPEKSGINPDGEDAHQLSVPDPYGMELAEYKKVLELKRTVFSIFLLTKSA